MSASDARAPFAEDPRPIVVYDGRCRFCTTQAARLERWLRGRVRLESFRDPGVIERHPGLTAEACERAIQLVLPDGRILAGAAAISRALRLRPLLAPAGWLYLVPGLRQLMDWGYGVVARNRFRLQGEVCEGDACRMHQRDPPPGRARVRNLFLRLLGVIFVVAFLSLAVQSDVLWGSRGLLPAQTFLDAIRSRFSFFDAPTIFWLGCGDGTMRVAALAGALLGVAIALGFAARWCLLAAWALYLSFSTIGQSFLSFQWDTLLLETAFFALFLAPGGLRLRRAAPPHPIAIFLMLWLLFRLHVESGLAKLCSGDVSWELDDLSAMASYWETAPLPTWLGWWAHQMPLSAQQAASAVTLAVEIVVPVATFPLFLLGRWRRLRAVVFAIVVGLQLGILLTGNFAFFNWLTIALSLFLLDDGHLAWVARRFGRTLAPAPPRAPSPWCTAGLALAALALVPLSVLPFLRVIPAARPAARAFASVEGVLEPLRTLNAYHLFAAMTLVRHEVVIEGTADGKTWEPYEFRWKPGDSKRAPGFVAPYQPRVDFQLWFLLLDARNERWFHTLLRRLLEDPTAVAPLFSRDPFPSTPPVAIRYSSWRYRFSDRATRRATGEWWRRDLEATSPPKTLADLRRG